MRLSPFFIAAPFVFGEEEVDCGKLIVRKEITRSFDLSAGPYATDDPENDWKALFLIDTVGSYLSESYSAFPDWEVDVEVKDLRNELDCTEGSVLAGGRFCDEINLAVSVQLSLDFVTKVECPEPEGSGSGDEESADEAGGLRKRRNVEFDTSGLDLNVDFSVVENVEALTQAIDDQVDQCAQEDAPEDCPDELDTEASFGFIMSEVEEETSTVATEELNGETTVTEWGDSCPSGYEGPLCKDDINECESQCLDTENYDCINQPGTFICIEKGATECPEGYSGNVQDEDGCQDENECEADENPCGLLPCENTLGSFSCSCPAGYEFNYQEGECEDVNECERKPCSNAQCNNIEGSYECNCLDGYYDVLNNGKCELTNNLDCFGGTNGGCSHFCTVTGCECPECWTLLSNGKECAPANEYLHVTCAASSMTMAVDECVYGSGEDLTIVMMNNECEATKADEGNEWSAYTSLDGCNTTAQANGDMIEFSNTFTVQSRESAIVMHSDPEITFTCAYAASVDGVSTAISVLGKTQASEGSHSGGSFEFTVDFVTYDSNGDFITGANDTMVVGERVYFDVKNVDPINGVNFIVQECSISDGNGNTHNIIEDNCLDRHTSVSREAPFDSVIASESTRFGYTAFIFAASPDKEELELTCRIAACLEDECEELENECQARRRRTVIDKSKMYKVKTVGRFADW